MQHLVKKQIYILFSLVAVLASFSFAHAQTSSSTLLPLCSSFSNGFAQMSAKNKPTNTQEVIQNMCNSLINLPDGCMYTQNDTTEAIYIYKDSVFLYELCNQFRESTQGTDTFKIFFNENFSSEYSYLKDEALSTWKKTKNCPAVDKKENKDFYNCDLSVYFGDLFSIIMDNYFSLKQSKIYGLEDATAPLDIQIAKFSLQYFPPTANICDTTTNLYPKTCKILTKYMEKAKKLATVKK